MTGVVISAVSLLFAVFGRLELFLCLAAALAVHEAGHYAAARIAGENGARMSFSLFSASMSFERTLTPQRELIIALGGPLAGLFAALAAAGLVGLSGFFDAIFPFVSFSIALTLVNMLPALPLDGGRVLRAGLCMLAGKKSGEKIARAISLFIALLLTCFGAFAAVQGEINLSAFAMAFLVFTFYFKSRNEALIRGTASVLYEQSRMKKSQSAAARTVAIRGDCTVERALILADGFELVAIVDENMRLLGTLSRGDLLCAAVGNKNNLEIRKLI